MIRNQFLIKFQLKINYLSHLGAYTLQFICKKYLLRDSFKIKSMKIIKYNILSRYNEEFVLYHYKQYIFYIYIYAACFVFKCVSILGII